LTAYQDVLKTLKTLIINVKVVKYCSEGETGPIYLSSVYYTQSNL